MIIEYAQLLSTAHRISDGTEYIDASSGRKIKRWRLNDLREQALYKASHVNHPDAVWARSTKGNYEWLYKLFVAVCNEYTKRYGKVHLTDEKLRSELASPPENVLDGIMTTPPQCMPDACKDTDTVQAYKNYYIMEKKTFAKWKNTKTPEWFTETN
jgi:hypothetical protein